MLLLLSSLALAAPQVTGLKISPSAFARCGTPVGKVVLEVELVNGRVASATNQMLPDPVSTCVEKVLIGRRAVLADDAVTGNGDRVLFTYGEAKKPAPKPLPWIPEAEEEAVVEVAEVVEEEVVEVPGTVEDEAAEVEESTDEAVVEVAEAVEEEAVEVQGSVDEVVDKVEEVVEQVAVEVADVVETVAVKVEERELVEAVEEVVVDVADQIAEAVEEELVALTPPKVLPADPVLPRAAPPVLEDAPSDPPVVEAPPAAPAAPATPSAAVALPEPALLEPPPVEDAVVELVPPEAPTAVVPEPPPVKPPPPEGAHTLGDPVVDGSLDPGLIADTIDHRMGQVRSCYARGLSQRPDLAGEHILRFTIEPDGRVSSVQTVSTTLPDRATGDCINSRLIRGAFPLPDNRERVTVTYGFSFNPPAPSEQ